MPERKPVILLVEDDPLLREPLVEALQEEEYSILIATDGQEGLDRAMSAHPDLILLDIMMPIMDGLAVMQAIRKDEKWGMHVPIILLTNLSPDEERIMNAINQYEPAYYLVKSDWKLSDVINKVQECLPVRSAGMR